MKLIFFLIYKSILTIEQHAINGNKSRSDITNSIV